MISHRDSVPTVVGVDVGGPKKGFHAVVIRGGQFGARLPRSTLRR